MLSYSFDAAKIECFARNLAILSRTNRSMDVLIDCKIAAKHADNIKRFACLECLLQQFHRKQYNTVHNKCYFEVHKMPKCLSKKKESYILKSIYPIRYQYDLVGT